MIDDVCIMLYGFHDGYIDEIKQVHYVLLFEIVVGTIDVEYVKRPYKGNSSSRAE